MIISNIQKDIGKGSSLIIDSVIDCIINISNYNILAGDGFIKLQKELNHAKKGLVLIKTFMVINALNGVYSDVYIFQIILRQKLEGLMNYLRPIRF